MRGWDRESWQTKAFAPPQLLLPDLNDVVVLFLDTHWKVGASLQQQRENSKKQNVKNILQKDYETPKTKLKSNVEKFKYKSKTEVSFSKVV